jgi:hypothetical protein
VAGTKEMPGGDNNNNQKEINSELAVFTKSRKGM